VADPQLDAYLQLGALAEAAYTLAGDVMAFDSRTLRGIPGNSTTSALDDIAALSAAARKLVRAFRNQRDAYVAAQMRRLPAAYVGRPFKGAARSGKSRTLKVNLGSGRFPLKGWLNVDLPPAQLGLNLRWGLPLRDGSVKYVFMSHVLEHFYYPHEALGILREIRRVLAPSGRVRIIVPDIQKFLVAYATGDRAFFEARKQVWPRSSQGTRLEQLLLYTGTGRGASPSFFFGHKGGYDYETLRRLLRRAGFTDVQRSDYMASSEAALRVDDHSAVADASFKDGQYSLFVEATGRRT
jgi:predicted SAM-dependent methyltransferase